MAEAVPKPKRAKTSIACTHCHRSHMTCDSTRPCKRCVKRGLQDTCVDAPRKRKKYLADVPSEAIQTNLSRQTSNEDALESLAVQASASMPPQLQFLPESTDMLPSATQPTPINGNSRIHIKPQTPASRPIGNSHIPSSSRFMTSPTSLQTQNSSQYDNMLRHRSKFMSSAADLEYSTLSSIISADNFPRLLTEHTPNSGHLPAISPPVQAHDHSMAPQAASPNTAINEAFLIANKPILYDKDLKYDEAINQYFLGPIESSERHVMYPDVQKLVDTLRQTDPTTFYERNSKLSLSFALGILPDELVYTRVLDPSNAIQQYIKEPEDIYEKVNKPYSYTPGYHLLIAYLRKRFSKEMLVQMVESMAKFRPSFIACTNLLKEHDLIFMEQCFQRTLLTYDLIIKVSGTPTIVWRRTGEIAYVGNEFCILTGWTKEELLSNKKRFIVELLDDKSVLEYFQLFLSIAFGDFLGATMTECTLLTRNPDVNIRTRCSWTLKRDVFGIPMMIIGNFLPVFD